MKKKLTLIITLLLVAACLAACSLTELTRMITSKSVQQNAPEDTYILDGDEYAPEVAMEEAIPMYGMPMGEQKEDQTLILNAGNKLVKRLLKTDFSQKTEKLTGKIVEQLYDLALLSRGALSQERMTAFIKRSQELMLDLE